MANSSLSRRSFVKGALALPIAFAAAVAVPESQEAFASSKPGKVTITSCTAKRTTIKLKWKAVSGAAGYQSELYTDKKRSWKQSDGDYANTNITFQGLDAATFYYVRVRAYRWSGGKRVYGAWSKLKLVHTKATVKTAKGGAAYLRRYLEATTGKSEWYVKSKRKYSDRVFAAIASDDLDRSTWRYLCASKNGAVYKADKSGNVLKRLCA